MNTVGILGGMGPAAGADFVRLFVHECVQYMRHRGQAVHDQGFPEHWLAQLPIPDRTQALLELPHSHDPLEFMAQALGRLVALGASSVAIACNTAHAWHLRLQKRFPQTELLHIAQETATHLAQLQVERVSILATEGTYRMGLYEDALARRNIQCHLPSAAQRALITQGIFEGVKSDNPALAHRCFTEVVNQLLHETHHAPVIMACTEIPLVLPPSDLLINPAEILARSLVQRAYA
jgi:aspartate racemase